MKNLFQLLCFTLLCITCSGEKQQVQKNIIEINMIPAIEGEAKEMPLQEWAKSVRFIPLKTNEDILISDIVNVYLRSDTLLVHQKNRLSLFNMDGKYLYDIGSVGQGPNEFLRIRGIVVHDDLIYVQEHNNRFKVYDWKGNFVKGLVFPHMVCGLITYPGKEEFLAYVSNRTGNESVRFYLMQDEQILDSVPNPFIYTKEPGAITLINIPEFYPSRGSLNAFMEVNSDTVYRVDEHLGTHPYIVFNMGKYLFSRRERYNATANDMMKGTFKGKYSLAVLGEIDENIFILKATGNPKNDRTFCYNKQTKELKKYFLTYSENDLDFLKGVSFVPNVVKELGIHEDASFVPKAVLNDRYLVDWERPDNEDNPVLVLVEP